MEKLKIKTTAALIAAGVSQMAFGQSTTPEPVQEIAPLVVTASRNASRLDQMPTSSTIITQEDIQKSSAQSVDQLLKTIPGFNFSGAPSYLSDPTGTQTKMRGLGNDKVLVLLDGIPVIDPFYETTQWFRVPMSSIDHIEVMRGGASSTWGSMAVGGVVNIITKTPQQNASEVSVSAGSQGTTNLAASKDIVASDALRLNLTATRFETKGYLTTPSQFAWLYPGRQPNTTTNEDYQMSAFFTPAKDLKGFVRLGMATQNQDIYNASGINLQKSPNISGGITQSFDDKSSLDTKFWAQNVAFTKFNEKSCYFSNASTCYNGDGTLPSAAQAASLPVATYYSQFGDQSYGERGASSVYSMPLTGLWNSLQLGVDYRQLSVKDSEKFYGSPQSVASPQNFSGSYAGTGTQTFSGAFVQAKFSPTDALQVTVSGRYDGWNNTERTAYFTRTTGATSGGASADLSKTQIDPSIGVHYDVNDAWDMRGAVFKAFRAPGLNNQTRSYGTGSGLAIANPDLVPETVTSLELGADHKSAQSKFSATYFLTSINNMIATTKVSSLSMLPPIQQSIYTAAGGTSSSSFYTNNQNGQANGIELTEKWKANDQLTIDAFYTYTHTFLTSTWNGVTTPINTQLAGIPRTTASLSATWQPVEKVKAYLQAFYMGPLSVQQTGTSAGAVTLNALQGSNTIYNGSVNYAYDRSTDLFVNATNIFNHSYQDGTYTATSPQGMTLAPPRSFMVGARYRF